MQKKFSLSQQLSTATGRPMSYSKPENTQNKFRFLRNLKPCARWTGDGIDHINISNNARTDLGRALSPSFALKFVHDVFGEKTSISNLWNDIDKFVGAKAVVNHDIELPFLLLDAMWQRIKQYPKLADELKNTELPIDMYSYNEAELPFRRALAYWWLEGIYAIREALYEGYEYPNFDSIIYGRENRRETILSDFLSTYIPNRRSVVQKREQETQDPKTPSLVKQLRSTPPMVQGLKKFSMTVSLSKNVPKVEPVAEEPVKTNVVDYLSKLEPKVKEMLNDLFDGVDVKVEVPSEEVGVSEKTDSISFEDLKNAGAEGISLVVNTTEEKQEEIPLIIDVVETEDGDESGCYTQRTLGEVEELLAEHGVSESELKNVESVLIATMVNDELYSECIKKDDFEIDFTSKSHCFTVRSENGRTTIETNPLDALVEEK